MELHITADDFQENLPRRYTCDGQDISPPLAWSGLPARCRSLALIVDDPDTPDPDAPRRTWVHWVLYNIPPGLSELNEAAEAASLPEGTGQGLNDWDRIGWSGPCPPRGRHRYVFKLYALDTSLSDLGHPTKEQLERAMQGHVLAQAQVTGYYARA